MSSIMHASYVPIGIYHMRLIQGYNTFERHMVDYLDDGFYNITALNSLEGSFYLVISTTTPGSAQ